MLKRIKDPLISIARWLDDRTGILEAIGPILRHKVPPRATWGYVFGSATLVAFLIQVVTGTLLTLAYIPSASEAYPTLQFITNEAPFGNLLRGIHFFGASAMVLLVGIHMARTFLTAAYKFPREMNWLSGVALLALTLLMGFTGQLLRWDQNAIWSVVVGAEQAARVPLIGPRIAHFVLGGEVLGGATLSRFFATHVFFIPGLIYALLGLHLYLVIRNGITDWPRAGDRVDPRTERARYEAMIEKEGVPFWPDAMWRDILFGTGVVLVIVALALFFGPPALTRPPDPTIIQAQPRPDWYLLWYFAVLALLPHGTEGVVIVGAPLVAGLALMGVPFLSNRGERSPSRRPWSVAIVVGVCIMIASFTVAGYRASWSPDFNAPPLPVELVGASSGPIYRGAQLFHEKACLYCHEIGPLGGHRGPDLSLVGERLTPAEMIIRISNGGTNMPGFGATLKPGEMDDLVAFLQSRARSGSAASAPGSQ